MAAPGRDVKDADAMARIDSETASAEPAMPRPRKNEASPAERRQQIEATIKRFPRIMAHLAR